MELNFIYINIVYLFNLQFQPARLELSSTFVKGTTGKRTKVYCGHNFTTCDRCCDWLLMRCYVAIGDGINLLIISVKLN